MTIAAGGVISIAPIVQIIISLDILTGLSDGGVDASGSGRQGHLRQAAVGIQIALTLMLLGVAGTLTRSFLHLQRMDVDTTLIICSWPRSIFMARGTPTPVTRRN
jgi:hypothetical protein